MFSRSFTSAELTLLEAALYFDKLVLLDPAGTSWETIWADHHACEAVMQLKCEGILQMVTPADVLVKHGGPPTDATHQNMHDQEFRIYGTSYDRALTENELKRSLKIKGEKK
jgi:hypothetical protein